MTDKLLTEIKNILGKAEYRDDNGMGNISITGALDILQINSIAQAILAKVREVVEGAELTGRAWEAINKKAGVDVLNIVVNLDGRYTPSQQAELIVERCNLTAQSQLQAILKAIDKEEV